ncbi:Retrovirus-related Pol polyprotein from type-2 retrotransposable element R2DM, partial [Diplonema papillatum]
AVMVLDGWGVPKVESGVEMGSKKGGVLVAANTEDAEYAWGAALDLIGVCPGAKVAVVCTVPWAESARHLVVLSDGNHQDVWAKYYNVTPPTVSCKTVAPGQPTTQVCLFQVRAAYVHATTWETAMKAGQSVRIMAKKAAEAEGLRMDWSSVFTKVHRRQGVCEVSVRVPVEDVPKLLRSSGKAGTFWKAMSFVNGTDTLPAVWVSDCALEEARQIASRTPNTFGVIGGAKTGVFGIRTTPEHVAATESAVGKKLSKRQRRGDKYIVTTACPAEHPSDLLAACAAAEWNVEPVGSFKRRGDTVCVVIADQGPPAPVLYRLDRASISIRKYDRSIDARQKKGFTTQCQRVKINLPREFLASLQERPEPVPGQKRSRASDETTTQDKVARVDTADNMATDCRHANWQESYENDKAFLCEVCCKLTINVTSLLKNVLLLCGIVADIICLQETKLTSTGQKKIRMALKECAALDVWQPFFGSCCEGRKCGNDVPSQITGGSAGVAILVRKGLPACVVSPFDVVEERAYEAARFLHVRVATGSGKGALHVVSLYGHCGHSARIEREKLVEGVLWGMRRRLGAVPIVVAGDLNTDPLNSPALRFALRNGWTDCAELHAKSLNRPPEHTCYHGEPSRIDLVLTNEIASSALGNVETFEAGFPTHKAIRAVFHLTAFQQLNAVFRFPRAIPGSGLTDRTDTAALKAVVAKYRLADPCPRGLEGSQRVDFLWLRISRAAEDYLLQKSKIEGNLAAYRGRGERRRLSTQRVSARPSPEGAGADTAPLKRARCLLGRMREYSAARAKWEDMSSAPCPLSLLLKGQWDKIRSFQSFILQQSFAWVKKEAPPTFYFTNGRDGRLTANLVEVDATVRRKWDPVLRMYAGKKEPEFAPFLREYGDFIAQHPCQLGPITADRLRSIARKKGVQSSCGVDGWRMREVAALPDTILEGFAAVLNEVEETGLWPDGVLDALVTLIPKGEGDDPLKLRPITVSSVVYRLWASVRLQEVLVWQEQWIHESQHGFRKGHSCDDVIMDIALSIEESLINGTPLHGIALDFAKCFDRVPQGLVLDLVEALGLHERVLAPLRHVYKYLRRRFRYPLGVGDEFKVTNGILQGCPISVVLINALLSVLSKALVSRARVSPKSFADDLYLLSRLAKLLQEGIEVTAIFGNLTGLALNEGKCAAFSTSKKGPRLEVGGKAMKSVKTVKVLGVPLGTEGPVDNDDRGIRHYGAAYCANSAGGFANNSVLRTALSACLIPRSNRAKSPLATLTLVAKAHLCDPACASGYSSLRTAAKQYQKERFRLRMDALLVSGADASLKGPVGLISNLLREIRFLPAKRHSFELLSFEGATVPFSGKEALHFVREGLRLRAWRYLTTQRQGYSGIERGVDVRLLNRLWQNRATGDRLSFAIRKCIAGAVYSREWCNRKWGTGDGVCEFCDGGTPGTLLHYFWECPGPGGRWVNLHCRLDVAGVAAQNMPLCLSTRGIPPIGTPPVLVERVQKLIGTISIEMAQAQHNIATTRPWELASAAAGRYDVELARDSRELLTKQIGTRFAASLVSTLNNLASLLFHKRTPQSWKEADEMYRTALEKQQRLEELHGDAAAEQVAEGRTETANNLRVLTNTRRKWAAVKLQATFRRFCARARCRRMREAHRCFPLLAVHAGDGGVEPRHDFFGAYRLRAPAAWLHGYPTWDMAEEAPDYDARVRARGGGGEPAAAAGSRECTVFPYCIARAAGRWCVGTELNRDMAFRQVLRSDREGAGSPADCTAYSVDGSHAARAPRRKTSTTALISEVPPTPRFTASSVVIQPLHHRLQALEAADRSAVARDEEAAAAQALDKARQGPRGRADKEKAQQARSVGTLEAYRRAQLEKDCLERFAMLLYQSEAARRELDLKRVVRKFEDLLEQAAEALGCDEFYILSDDSESEEGADRPPPATRKAEKKERAQVLAAAKDGARRIAAERAAAAEQLGVVADELRARVAAGRAEGALREAAAARLAGEKLAEALYGDEARTRGGLTAAEGSERDSLAAVSRNTLANTRAASEAVGLAVRDEEKGRAAVAAEEAGNRLENERDSAAVLSKNAVARAAAEAVREEGEGRAAVAGAEAKDRQGVDKAWHRGRAQCEKLALHGAAEARRRNDVARAEWSAREDMQEAVVQHRHGVAAAGLLRGEAAARADVAAAERTEHEAHAARRSETFQSHEPAAVGAGATRLLTEEAAMRLRAADRRDDAFHRICKQARAELREVVEAAVRQEEAQRALIHVEQAASAGGLTESLAGAACEADRRGMDRVKLDEIIERDNLRKSHAERLRALCASFDGETQARLLEQRCRQLGFTGDVRSPAALAAFRQGLYGAAAIEQAEAKIRQAVVQASEKQARRCIENERDAALPGKAASPPLLPPIPAKPREEPPAAKGWGMTGAAAHVAHEEKANRVSMKGEAFYGLDLIFVREEEERLRLSARARLMAERCRPTRQAALEDNPSLSPCVTPVPPPLSPLLRHRPLDSRCDVLVTTEPNYRLSVQVSESLAFRKLAFSAEQARARSLMASIKEEALRKTAEPSLFAAAAQKDGLVHSPHRVRS